MCVAIVGQVIRIFISHPGHLGGAAEVALMCQRVYEQLRPQSELCPSNVKIKGLYGPNHSLLEECTVKGEILELAVAIHYDVIVDDIEEDFSY